jgi:hypothetical protein
MAKSRTFKSIWTLTRGQPHIAVLSPAPNTWTLPPNSKSTPSRSSIMPIISRQIDYLGKMPVVTPKPARTSKNPEDMLRYDLDNENETIANARGGEPTPFDLANRRSAKLRSRRSRPDTVKGRLAFPLRMQDFAAVLRKRRRRKPPMVRRRTGSRRGRCSRAFQILPGPLQSLRPRLKVRM